VRPWSAAERRIRAATAMRSASHPVYTRGFCGLPRAKGGCSSTAREASSQAGTGGDSGGEGGSERDAATTREREREALLRCVLLRCP
jgi:hypothetical protein